MTGCLTATGAGLATAFITGAGADFATAAGAAFAAGAGAVAAAGADASAAGSASFTCPSRLNRNASPQLGQTNALFSMSNASPTALPLPATVNCGRVGQCTFGTLLGTRAVTRNANPAFESSTSFGVIAFTSLFVSFETKMMGTAFRTWPAMASSSANACASDPAAEGFPSVMMRLNSPASRTCVAIARPSFGSRPARPAGAEDSTASPSKARTTEELGRPNRRFRPLVADHLLLLPSPFDAALSFFPLTLSDVFLSSGSFRLRTSYFVVRTSYVVLSYLVSDSRFSASVFHAGSFLASS